MYTFEKAFCVVLDVGSTNSEGNGFGSVVGGVIAGSEGDSFIISS